MVSELEMFPERSLLTILPASWLSTSRLPSCGWPASDGRFDKANTSAKSDRPAKAGSNRLTESTVAAEPLVAVPAAKSTPVWKMPCGVISLTATKPLVCGSYEMPSIPMLGTKVPRSTVCTSERSKVAPAT